MSIFLDVLVAVAANILSEYVRKWLDRHSRGR